MTSDTRPSPERMQRIVNEAARQMLEHSKKEQERLARFGHVLPQIVVDAFGKRLIGVGSRIYSLERCRFFTDFLREYISTIFGKEWFEAEVKKADTERHPLMQWRLRGLVYMNNQPPQPDGTRAAPPNGALAGFMSFAYDLYVVDANGRLDPVLLDRLRHTQLFQGARHELFAEATCLRAGFTIEREDESDRSSKHAEFTATHRGTGQKISVEAKSRHRPGVLGMRGSLQPYEKMSLRFGELLNSAIRKNPAYPLVIFLDTNLPARTSEKILGRCSGADTPARPMPILEAMLERVRKDHGGRDPYNCLILTNHPHHYAAPDEVDPKKDMLWIMPLPHMATRPVAHPGALMELGRAAKLYGNVPMDIEL